MPAHNTDHSSMSVAGRRKLFEQPSTANSAPALNTSGTQQKTSHSSGIPPAVAPKPTTNTIDDEMTSAPVNMRKQVTKKPSNQRRGGMANFRPDVVEALNNMLFKVAS